MLAIAIATVRITHEIRSHATDVSAVEGTVSRELTAYNVISLKFAWIKTHSSVSCGPRSRRATPRVYLQEERKRHFHTFVSR